MRIGKAVAAAAVMIGLATGAWAQSTTNSGVRGMTPGALDGPTGNTASASSRGGQSRAAKQPRTNATRLHSASGRTWKRPTPGNIRKAGSGAGSTSGVSPATIGKRR